MFNGIMHFLRNITIFSGRGVDPPPKPVCVYVRQIFIPSLNCKMLILGKAYDYFGSDAAMDAEVKTLTSALCPSEGTKATVCNSKFNSSWPAIGKRSHILKVKCRVSERYFFCVFVGWGLHI